jgi:HSP20 family protein
MQTKRKDFLSERQPAERWVVQGYMIFRPNAHFTPPTDVIEMDDKLIVLMEIAGMKANGFAVTLTNNRHLVITGTRERPPMQGAAYHRVEIGYGDFRVEVVLPWTVDEDDVSANYRDGFLQVELPRRPEKHIRIIDVDVEQTEEEETNQNDT